MDGTLYTALVNDTRPLTGDTAANPRVVQALPFLDKGDTSAFSDDYSCQAQVRKRICVHPLLGARSRAIRQTCSCVRHVHALLQGLT